MRISSFVLPGGTGSYGAVAEGSITDAGAILRARYPDPKSLIAADAINELANADGETFSFAAVEPPPTIPNPDKIICIGLDDLGHIKEAGRETAQKIPRSSLGTRRAW